MANYFCTDSVEEQVDYLTDKVKDLKTNKLDKAAIVQEVGTGTDVVMSQKAVTDELSKKSNATNLENGAGTGSIRQKGITYDKLITDYEPNMAAWIIAKNNGVVPANVSVYLTALQNSTVPTSEQVVNILNNRRTDVNTVIVNFKTLPSPYDSYGIDNLIAGALAGYGLTPSSDLSNIVGKVGSAAAILGAMNKAFSPGAFAGGVGCEAGDEGYPGDSLCSFAYGGYVKNKAMCSIGVGLNLENSGDYSAVFGIGNKEYKIEGSEAEKNNQRRYLNNLAEAGGTVTGTGDDRVGVTGINKGTNNFMAGNSHYIGDGAVNNAVVGNQNITSASAANNLLAGLNNYSKAENAVVMGSNNTATGKNATMFGTNGTASGVSSTTTGQENNNAGWTAFVTGLKNINSGKHAIVAGSENTVAKDNTATFGTKNNNKGNASLVAGQENTISHWASAVFGVRNKTGANYQIIGGILNEGKSNTLLELGYGDNDKQIRKNVFEVLDDGTIRIPNFNSSGSRIGMATLKVVNGVLKVIV